MSEKYTNRELSWLDFNSRILNEARDKNNPLFERAKFLSITSSNLDEFFMVRVASLKELIEMDCEKCDISGMTPKEQLKAVSKKTHEFVALMYSTYLRTLIPAMKNEKICIVQKHEELSEKQKAYVDDYFEENIYPVLTPMAVDSSRPFPLIRNKTLNIAAFIEKNKEMEFATVQVPSVIKRLVKIPSEEGYDSSYILLEEIIERHIDKLFLGYKVVCAHPYRVMRNADFEIDEDDTEDLMKEMQKQLKKRQWGEAIRLEIEDKADKHLVKRLKEELSIKDDDIYKIQGPIDLTFLMKMYGFEGYNHLKNEQYIPKPCIRIDKDRDIFEQIRMGDILLHHPYETFEPVLDFINTAANDENVLAIKQTLYRVSGNSPIIESLAKAAENGKQVTVLVELKARFDEENNINWAKKLEKAGCHVIYGLKGLKTHSKITLVVREEDDGIKRYVHLGTGNYNDSTAKLYTDTGLFTCKTSIGEDATAVFNMLSGYSEPEHWNKLYLAPLWLRNKFVDLINREKKNALENKEAFIVAKMNSLCDREIIDCLYEASKAGVKIELIVRGICCLRAGVAGLSENIKVRSIVGTFLEHSRIFYFHNGGNEEVYMSSADWMPRNLDKRVEILFPVEDEELKNEVIHILKVQQRDTIKAYIMNSEGIYEKIDKRGKEPLEAQKEFMREYTDRIKQQKPEKTRIFVPRTTSN